MNYRTILRCLLLVLSLAGCSGASALVDSAAPRDAVLPKSATSVTATPTPPPQSLWTWTQLYAFQSGSSNGYEPAVIQFVGGLLYGTTMLGGSANKGTLYEISPNGSGERVLHSFTGGTGGGWPGALIYYNGAFYGSFATYGCAQSVPTACGPGGVFTFVRGTYRVLHYFGQTAGDGRNPSSALVPYGGLFYGVTCRGGTFNAGYPAYGGGTLYAMTTNGAVRVLHDFGGSGDGSCPQGEPVELNGTLYGNTHSGGQYDDGVMYSISPGGTYRVLHSWGGPGGPNEAGRLLYYNGKFYGFSMFGGASETMYGGLGYGTFYSINTDGSDATVLHSFFNSVDGNSPGSTAFVNGTFYINTTVYSGYPVYGYILTIDVHGNERIIHVMNNVKTGGCNGAGFLFVGTIAYGVSGCGSDNWGEVFKMTPPATT